MNRRIHGALAAAAFALYALVGVAAFAQPGPGDAKGPGGPPRGMGMMRSPPTPAERAGRLRDLLQLKPAQESALQAFVAALDAGRPKGLPPAEAWPQTTPERLDRLQKMSAEHQSRLEAIADATRRFYDQLEPAQKRAFDALPMPMMGPGMGGGWGMGHFGGPMMDPPPPPPDR
jgi:hypothetical protein